LHQVLGQTVPDVATSNASLAKAGDVVVPSIIVPSLKTIGSAIKTNCSTLDEFIGNFDVKRLSDLSSFQYGSTSIVIAWYDSVYEGVDIWYPVSQYSNEPRSLSIFIFHGYLSVSFK
jgi:hypothetical protein